MMTMQSGRFAQVREGTGLSAYAFAKELLKRDVIKGVDHYYRIERGEIVNVSIDIENGIISTVADLSGKPFNAVLVELRGVEAQS